MPDDIYMVCIETSTLNGREQYMEIIRYPATTTRGIDIERGMPYDFQSQAVDDLARRMRAVLPEAVIGPATILVGTRCFTNDPAGLDTAIDELQRNPPSCTGLIATPKFP